MEWERNAFARLLLTTWDSATPQGLASVVHVMAEPGHYTVRERTGQASRAVRSLEVVDDPSLTPPAHRLSIDLVPPVRLGRVPGEVASSPQTAPSVRTPSTMAPLALPVGSPILLQRSVPVRARGETPGQAEIVDRAGDVVWSTGALDRGDLFAVVPLRPGVYRLQDGRRTGSIRVAYPDPRPHGASDRAAPLSGPGISLPPVRPEQPFGQQIDLHCGQGLVLTAEAGARFIVALEEPDDGPRDLEEWRASHDRELLEGLRVHR